MGSRLAAENHVWSVWNRIEVTWGSLGCHLVVQIRSNPCQIQSNPVQIRSKPVQIRIRIGPWPLQVGSGWSRQVGNHRKSSQPIRTQTVWSIHWSIQVCSTALSIDNPSVALIHYTSTSKSVQTGSCRVQTGYICTSKSTNKQVGCIPKSAQHGSEAPASRTRHGRTQPSGAKSGSDPSRVRPVFKTS